MREKRKVSAVLAILIVLLALPMKVNLSHDGKESVKYSLVHSWAEKLGVELWHLGDFITRRKDVQESFKPAQVVARAGQKIVEDMAKEIKYMMDLKISAVKRIMDAAEINAMSHDHEPPDELFEYYNAKEMIEPGEIAPTPTTNELEEHGKAKILVVPPKDITLTENVHFYHNAINTTVSSVHVPTNVYDRATDVIHAIKWSEELDSIFRNNYRMDPTLSWQFFGSASGFMRQFPATKWQQDPVDLYDCRLRAWFIEAANSPKDIMILVDNSGSMTGQRRDIAKHVAANILDTLGPNDFVNVYTFSDELKPIVPCFRDILVQANMGNVRELKFGMDDIETGEIANFTSALTKAFDILEMYRTERLGAKCNQAIMLISDGVPYAYKDIFEMYNWQNLPEMPVRVFTYLIGKEVAEVKEIKDMACNNRGFYVHLSTLAEVREMVLNYIPVMARPLVLGRHEHPVIWTQVYADVVDTKMTDWLWEIKEREEQKERFVSQRLNRDFFHSKVEQNRRFQLKRKKNQEQSYESDKYHLMTTVSMPVFDLRDNANLTEDVLINEAYWVSVTRETRIANLLGVAGTDLPINDIKKLMMPYLLGVNGYAFIVTNNGYILTHPDFRPLFQDILKPAYNSIDMVEVELMDDDREPRDFSPMLLGIRDSIINQSSGSKWMLVKYHFDDMKRVSRIKRQYYWTALKNTPFTLVVTYPDGYGVNRLQTRTEDEIHRVHAKGSNVVNFFSGRHWKIHPDWLYCKHNNKTFSSAETELLYFLERMKAPGWRWPLNRTPPPPEHAAINSNTSTGRSMTYSDKDGYYCDRNLMQALVFDARVTEWFSRNMSSVSTKDEKGPSPIAVLMGLLPRVEFKQRFGVTVAFLATHSGLTRWQDFHTNLPDEIKIEQEFSDSNRRSVDEIWYKRAVEQHFVEASSFVYSVPFDAGPQNDTLVTASHAIFHGEGGKSAPAAVVGFQFQHTALYTLFKNITSNCVDAACSKTCASEELECFVLDNNGYILLSPSLEDTGRFFGEVRGSLLQRLVDEHVYKQVQIYDYQAVCFQARDSGNVGNVLQMPWTHLVRTATLLLRWLLWTFAGALPGSTAVAGDYAYPAEETYADSDYAGAPEATMPSKTREQEFDRRVLINKTRPQPCDTILTLYQLNTEKEKTVYKTPASGCTRPFVVVPIPASNLILLVVDAMCPADDPNVWLSTIPVENTYNNETLACYKESSIELCGKGATIDAHPMLVFVPALIFHLAFNRN